MKQKIDFKTSSDKSSASSSTSPASQVAKSKVNTTELQRQEKLRTNYVHLIAKLRLKKTVMEYTEAALNNKNLCSSIKRKLLAINQPYDRLGILKRVQKHTLENLFKTNEEFYTDDYHYDWWAFPMHVPLNWRWQKWNYDASVNFAEAQKLLSDKDFVTTYTSCITLYLNALDKNGWNDYPVRFARLLHSMYLFIKAAGELGSSKKDVYESLCQLGERAVKYAEKHIKSANLNYPVFMSGLEATSKELEKYSNSLKLASQSKSM